MAARRISLGWIMLDKDGMLYESLGFLDLVLEFWGRGDKNDAPTRLFNGMYVTVTKMCTHLIAQGSLLKLCLHLSSPGQAQLLGTALTFLYRRAQQSFGESQFREPNFDWEMPGN